MKIKLSIFVRFVALFMVLGCATTSFAQDGQITGGYGDADVKDKDVVAAAKFAVKKGGQKQRATITLVSLNKAQLQVVAGLNYKICLQVSVKKSRKKAMLQFVETVVYKNLKNVYSLTSWVIKKESECGN